MTPYSRELWDLQDGELVAMLGSPALILEVPSFLPESARFSRLYYCDMCGSIVARRTPLSQAGGPWITQPSGCTACCRAVGRFFSLRFPVEMLPGNEEMMPPTALLIEILANTESHA